jgi:Arc/MetJ-type ribon-helix-helix transcriptional regulator
VTIQLKPEHEQIVQQQLASGLYGSVEEVLTAA